MFKSFMPFLMKEAPFGRFCWVYLGGRYLDQVVSLAFMAPNYQQFEMA